MSETQTHSMPVATTGLCAFAAGCVLGASAEPINSNDTHSDDELQTTGQCYILPRVFARRRQQGFYQEPPVAGSKTTPLPAVLCRATGIRGIKTQGSESKGFLVFVGWTCQTVTQRPCRKACIWGINL